MDAKFFDPGIYEFVVFLNKTRAETEVVDKLVNQKSYWEG